MMTVVSDTEADGLLYLARAARLVLDAEAATTDEMGRPTVDSLAAAREAGAFALTTPRRFGGLDADNRTMLRVFSELAAGCTSTSWIAQVSGTAKAMFTDSMTPEAQEAFYTDPHVTLCGTAMPLGRARAVPGGLRVTGRWPYASGCLDAPWAMVGIGDSHDEAVRPHPVVLPTSELTIEHTWSGVPGLRGTGSHTLVADDVFVPRAFQIDVGLVSIGARPLQVALHTASTLLGAAQGALGVVDPVMTAERPVIMTAYRRKAESPSARQLFADAHHSVTTAEMRLVKVADVLDTVLAGGASLSAVDTAQQRWQIVTAVQECRAAVEKLLDLHGSSAFAAGNPLARFWRDLSVGSRHGIINPYVAAEGYGRVLVETAEEGQA
jgi:alkylation response protein AidB-like acyl-CoA dehydrogenase